MDPQAVLTIGQQALYMLLMVSAPVLLTVLGIGLFVSVFQAATQINEPTLSFVPKLVGAVVMFALAGPWMLGTLVDFIRRTMHAIPGWVA